MSSTPVVLCAEVDGLIYDTLKTKKAEDSDAFSEVEHKCLNPVAVFTMHALTSLIYILQ